jgi:hypothetical protein
VSEPDTALKQAWHRFCDELKAAGDVAFRPTAAQGSVDRAAGVRLLSRNIALALLFELENNDAEHPELLHYFDPLRKQGGDNTDALYVGAPINGSDTYRVSGQRGSARYFGVTVVERGVTPWGGGVAGMLLGEQIRTAPDGSFELYLSPEPHPGNWIRTTPQSFRVTFRQFFADWENEAPMEARIDRLTGDGAPPALTPERVAAGLAGASHWVNWSLTYWADMTRNGRRSRTVSSPIASSTTTASTPRPAASLSPTGCFRPTRRSSSACNCRGAVLVCGVR